VSDERLATGSTAFPIVRINAIECQRTAGKIQDLDPSSRDPDPLAALSSSSSPSSMRRDCRVSRFMQQKRRESPARERNLAD